MRLFFVISEITEYFLQDDYDESKLPQILMGAKNFQEFPLKDLRGLG
jgi:hypothetical protein